MFKDGKLTFTSKLIILSYVCRVLMHLWIRQYGFVPFSVLDPSSNGRQTREGSRTLEYAFEDFAIRQVALLLNKTSDVTEYTNRSSWFRNVWDPTVKSDSFKGILHRKPIPLLELTEARSRLHAEALPEWHFLLHRPGGLLAQRQGRFQRMLFARR